MEANILMLEENFTLQCNYANVRAPVLHCPPLTLDNALHHSITCGRPWNTHWELKKRESTQIRCFSSRRTWKKKKNRLWLWNALWDPCPVQAHAQRSTNIHGDSTSFFLPPSPQAKFLNSLEEKNTQSNTFIHSSGKCGLRNNDLLWLIFHLSAPSKQLTEVLWRKCKLKHFFPPLFGGGDGTDAVLCNMWML